MNECWINVWKFPVSINGTIYGIEYESVGQCYNKNKAGYAMKQIAYRLHVKLKDKPGVMSREYPPWRNFRYLKKVGIVK